MIDRNPSNLLSVLFATFITLSIILSGCISIGDGQGGQGKPIAEIGLGKTETRLG